MRISFTGDAMCEHTRLADYYDKENNVYCFDDVFSGVSHLFSQSDYNIVNLETPIAGEMLKYSFQKYSFNTPTEFASALQKANVNMVTTANNHALDRGIEGLVNTIQQLDEMGMEHTGTFLSRSSAFPLVKEINGIRIAFLAYTYGTEACFNKVYLKDKEQYLVNLTRNQELHNPIKRFFLCNPSVFAKIFRLVYRTVSPQNARKSPSDRKEKDSYQKSHFLKDIEYCKKKRTDFIILCLHSGGQFNTDPTEYTRQFCEFARKNGVDLIVGNHEHCIQKFDFDNRTIYSLGNLTSDYGIDRTPFDRLAEYSIVFHLYLEKKDSGMISEYGFSVVKSIRENNRIVTKMVSDLYNDASSDRKKQLISDTKECIQIFLNKKIEKFDIKGEYMLSEFL